jgi:hypothetical protein
LGFVALNPTYILPMLLPNAKPNNGLFLGQRVRLLEIAFMISGVYADGAIRIWISIIPGQQGHS